jgi:predicted Rossmann-fold nucleotide-binding protein
MSIQEVWPSGMMALLTQSEANSISLSSRGKLYELYRNCSLAVLNSGNLTDNSKELLENFESFEINVLRNERGLKIELINPPESAIVDGHIVKTLRNHLYAVLRDLVQIQIYRDTIEDTVKKRYGSEGEYITNKIFMLLRNAQVMEPGTKPNLAVCWGGHSICRCEYDYAYEVGIELGLRKIDICTGCGPGIMEAPMKGSMVGHSQQCASHRCRLIGLTEPSIIAAEPPNSMVSDLVILPDIEKRLEAFVRLGHVLIVFPGGPGTAEELLYILSIKLMEENRRTVLPLILTGNEESRPYFEALESFLIKCFGEDITRMYKLIINDPKAVAIEVKKHLDTVYDHRTIIHDSYCFNWALTIPEELQHPIEVNHASMAALNLHRDQEPWKLAANLRAAFSGIVTGNVKEQGIKMVAKDGPFTLHGDPDILESMETLLNDYIKQKRLLLSEREYKPCYILKKD